MLLSLAMLPLCAEPTWSYTNWTTTQTATTAENGNLAQSAAFSLNFSGNNPSSAVTTLNNDSVLVDGSMPYNEMSPANSYAIGDNAVLTLSLPGYCNVRAVRLWVFGTDGRVGITVNSVEGRTQSGGGGYTTISSSYDGKSVLPRNSVNTHTKSAGYCFVFANGDPSDFATSVDALRVNFGTMDNNGTAVREIEVIGEVVAAKTYTVTFLDKAGATLKVVENVEQGASVEAPEPPEVDGYVFVKWDTDFSTVLEDLTISPVYVERGIPIWEDVVSYNSTTVNSYLSGEINLFARDGVDCELNQGTIVDAVKGYNTKESLVNGAIETPSAKCCIGTGGSLTYMLPYAQDIGTLEIYTSWGDHGRDGATITSLEYQTANATEWTKVNIGEISYGLTDVASDASRYAFIATCPDPTSPLMSQAVKVRINFGKMDNNGTGIAEVCARRFIKSTYAWESEWYDATTDVELPASDNLMRKSGSALKILSQGTTTYSEITDASVLTDGVLKSVKSNSDLNGAIYPLGNKAVVDCEFDEPMDIRGLKLWTSFFEDSRDGIAVDYLEIKLKGEDFFRVVDTVPSFSNGIKGTTDQSKPYRLWAQIAAPTGEFMFSKVTALRIHFGNLELNCSTFSEIEVFGSAKKKAFILIIR